MVTCKDQECQSTDFDLDGNFCNECGEELEEEAEEEKLIVVGVIREVPLHITSQAIFVHYESWGRTGSQEGQVDEAESWSWQ